MAPKAPKTTKKRKTEKAPAIDKLLVPAIGICLALMGYQFFKGMTAASIDRIDVNDDLALREIFFAEVSGKESYAVLCHSDSPETLSIPISSVFSDAHSGGSSPANFRLLDCNHVLPDSEKSIAERFKLNLDKRPTIFVSGFVGEPKQIPSKHLKTGKMLDKVLKNMLEPRAAKLETTQDLRTKCLNQPYCAVLMKGSKTVDSATKKAIQKLLVEQPKVAFASIDTSVLYMNNMEEFMPELKKGRHRFVVFKKMSGSLDPKDKNRLVTSYAAMSNSGVSYGQMSNLIAEVLGGSTAMTKLTALPMIKTRTKKVEKEDEAKRSRKLDQKQRAENKANGIPESSSSSSTDNDGSKEGRRAERDRRRADHRKATGGRERTPEEIAEIERQRRIRMADAENAWTMQDGDLPPEGDFVGEDEEDMGDYMDDDDNDDNDSDDGDDSSDGGEDDDDVLDLD
mmetsp:Transcript_6498/g.10756  ORF Transcript_6498/g.10756 Transcript_6498/m.10756 type:complete len:454 (+) Transcript_6498:155-1516(+)|eukprot:CAMPEP_0119013178 /NCGR_PEP_ID=MMETSP1176-20130426/8096_1 /TAXON_ID=265551 /ORGANISM="Synedropsis recta cf, Strain CCMP1620" /LENGTH=453 /DNA_ID=CAMNT_0006966237 /DNA_START=128 /DNA_END=1489 /DNA_ORIENTATION=+